VNEPRRYLCIHAHFYQPPRENPWLEAVELQDSAAPYHDWNERIASECYVPNGAARILDGQGRIARIVNNYARLSFNFGPTLLSWLEEHAPRAYECVLAADRQSRQMFSGHGSALAQAYNHVILPLASRRHKYTQILWGIRDFQHRFGRDPEGLWLPELAVDVETLEILASLGIKFTILAPHQAARTRRRPWDDWVKLEHGEIDPTRAYRCSLPSGRSLALFFYDGPISHAVAFEKLLSNGENFARRLLGGFNDSRSWAQLMHIATDGETYGHHHNHGDMALAYALDYIERNQLARLTNYGEYLALYPPKEEVEIIENTSWSCVHGVERWQQDCGCNSGDRPQWRQHWRRPLREAFDWLRDELSPRCELEAAELLRDPAEARADYVSTVLDRSPASVNAFFARHAARELDPDDQVRLLKLMEIERHLMLMYTSCGWFFDELTGLETAQVLRYAGRAVHLAEDLFGPPIEEQFLTRLEQAWSNISSMGNGRDVYERFVRPGMVGLPAVAAHYAISSLFNGYRGRSSAYCYRLDLQESRVLENGKARLALGRARITSRTTRERLAFCFAVLHLGDHNLKAGICPFPGENAFRVAVRQTGKAFLAGDLTECSHLLDEHFEGAIYSLKSLFRDEQRRILSRVLDSTLAEAEAACRHVYEHHAPLLSFLADVEAPLPGLLRATAETVLSSAVERALAEPEPDLERVRGLLDTAARQNVNLDHAALELALRQRLNAAVEQWSRKPADLHLLEVAESVAAVARLMPFEVNLWNSQNAYYEMVQALAAQARLRPGNGAGELLERLAGMGERLGLAASAITPPQPTLPVEEPAPAPAPDAVVRRRRPRHMARGAS
jgi:alpha-amylase/alpha-mannosidase (GH57 family)